LTHVLGLQLIKPLKRLSRKTAGDFSVSLSTSTVLYGRYRSTAAAVLYAESGRPRSTASAVK